MTDEIRYLLSMSCAIPVLVGLYRYRKMDPKYHLFIYILLADAANETITFIGIKIDSFDPIAILYSNAHIFIRFVLFLLLVKQHGFITLKLQRFFIAVALIIAIYCGFQEKSLFKDYLTLLCFTTAMMFFISIDILNRQVMVINLPIKYNFWFWASCLFIIQSAYGFLVFGFYVLNLYNVPHGSNIGLFNLFINVFCYCLFAIIIFLIPQKKSFFKHQNPI